MLRHWMEFQAAVAARAGSRPDPRDKPDDDMSFSSDPEQRERRRLVSRRRETAPAPMHPDRQVLLLDTAAVRSRLARSHTLGVENDQFATSFFRFAANLQSAIINLTQEFALPLQRRSLRRRRVELIGDAPLDGLH